jgi:hypothetical protein
MPMTGVRHQGRDACAAAVQQVEDKQQFDIGQPVTVCLGASGLLCLRLPAQCTGQRQPADNGTHLNRCRCLGFADRCIERHVMVRHGRHQRQAGPRHDIRCAVSAEIAQDRDQPVALVVADPRHAQCGRLERHRRPARPMLREQVADESGASPAQIALRRTMATVTLVQGYEQAVSKGSIPRIGGASVRRSLFSL